MFSLDMRTVQNTQGLIFLVCFIIMLILWLQARSRYKGLLYWVVGFALSAAGNILIGFRDFIPVWLSVPFANSCYVSGYACLFIGLLRFVGKKVISVESAIALALFAAFVFVHVYYTFVEANLMARVVNVSVAVALLCGMCFLLLNRTRTIPQQYTLGVQIGFLLVIFVIIARLTGMPLIKTNDFMASGLYDTTSILFLSMAIIFLAFNLVLMVNRLSLAETVAAETDARNSEAKTKATFNATSVGFATVVDRKIKDINEAGCRMLGYNRDELLDQDTRIAYPSEEEYKAAGSLYSDLAQHNSAEGETHFIRKDGKIINVIITISALNRDDLSQGVVLSVLDITERKRAEEALAQSEEKYRTILHNMQDSYFEVDLAGNFTLVNEATCRNLGYTMEELIGQNFSIIAPDQDEVGAIFKAYNKVYKTGEPYMGFTFKAIRKVGSPGYAEVSISLIKNEKDRPIGFRSVGRDHTERKQLEQKLLEMATHDALTGLPNRTLLYDRCGVALANAQRNKKMLVIMTLDLDLFKDVNDTLGHDTGDKVLIAAAGRLTGALRKSDTVARMGGDEFVLLLWEIDDKDAAVSVAEKILEDFRQPFLIHGHSLIITVSMGIAIYPECGANMEELLKCSDRLMYSAKQNGRNRFAI